MCLVFERKGNIFACEKDSDFDLSNDSLSNDVKATAVWAQAKCDQFVPEFERIAAAASKVRDRDDERQRREEARDSQKAEQEAAREREKEEASQTVTLGTLARAFDENEAAANDKYLGQAFIVKGIVSKVTDDFPGLTVFIEAGGAEAGASTFDSSDTEKIKALKRGQRVKLRCEVRGTTFAGPLLLQPCRILD